MVTYEVFLTVGSNQVILNKLVFSCHHALFSFLFSCWIIDTVFDTS